MTSEPPDGLPRYRVLTGPDDDTFCRRVSEALELGFQLYAGPAVPHAEIRRYLGTVLTAR